MAKLLTWGVDVPENVVEGFQGLRQMLLKAEGEATMSEAQGISRRQQLSANG